MYKQPAGFWMVNPQLLTRFLFSDQIIVLCHEKLNCLWSLEIKDCNTQNSKRPPKNVSFRTFSTYWPWSDEYINTSMTPAGSWETLSAYYQLEKTQMIHATRSFLTLAFTMCYCVTIVSSKNVCQYSNRRSAVSKCDSLWKHFLVKRNTLG